jgi:hypothetical protein
LLFGCPFVSHVTHDIHASLTSYTAVTLCIIQMRSLHILHILVLTLCQQQSCVTTVQRPQALQGCLGVRLCAIGRRDVLCLGILHFGGFWIAITSTSLMQLSIELLVGRNPQQGWRGCATSNNLEAVIASAATMAWLWAEKCCQWLV